MYECCSATAGKQPFPKTAGQSVMETTKVPKHWSKYPQNRQSLPGTVRFA